MQRDLRLDGFKKAEFHFNFMLRLVSRFPTVSSAFFLLLCHRMCHILMYSLVCSFCIKYKYFVKLFGHLDQVCSHILLCLS